MVSRVKMLYVAILFCGFSLIPVHVYSSSTGVEESKYPGIYHDKVPKIVWVCFLRTNIAVHVWKSFLYLLICYLSICISFLIISARYLIPNLIRANTKVKENLDNRRDNQTTQRGPGFGCAAPCL